MISFTFWASALLLFFDQLHVQASSNSFQTVLLIEIFRHGAREPLHKLWDEVAQDFDNFENLTPVGMHQHFLIGQELRERYIIKEKFLSESYKRAELLVKSTDYDRTIQSAQSQLFGLYPPTSTKHKNFSYFPEKEFPDNYRHPTIKPSRDYEFHEGNPFYPFEYQPIPIRTTPKKYENFSLPWHSCPVSKMIVKDMQEKIRKSDVGRHLEEAGVYKRVGQFLNISQDNVDLNKTFSLSDIYDNYLYAGRNILKNNEHKELKKDLDFIHSYYLLYLLASNQFLLKIFATPTFNEISSLIKSNSEGSSKLKMVMFSSHDSTIQMILSALNATSLECLFDKYVTGSSKERYCMEYPEYASFLLFRVVKNQKGSHFVEVSFNDEIIEFCQSEEKLCTVDEFLQRLQHKTVENFDEECKVENYEKIIDSQVIDRKHKEL